jgi:hypothetical protein
MYLPRRRAKDVVLTAHRFLHTVQLTCSSNCACSVGVKSMGRSRLRVMGHIPSIPICVLLHRQTISTSMSHAEAAAAAAAGPSPPRVKAQVEGVENDPIDVDGSPVAPSFSAASAASVAKMPGPVASEQLRERALTCVNRVGNTYQPTDFPWQRMIRFAAPAAAPAL